MNKTLPLLALILLLSMAGCDATQPDPLAGRDPLVLPYVLFDQEFHGNQATVTLNSACPMDLQPDQYCFHVAMRAGEGQTTVGINVITVPLREGYRADADVDWAERIGDQTGSGGVWEGPIEPGTELASDVAFGLADQADYPVALFVKLAATEQGNVVTLLQTEPPVAVLQILPDGGGVVRLDQ